MAPDSFATSDTPTRRRASQTSVARAPQLDTERSLKRRSQTRLADLLGDDAELVSTGRANLLLVGPDDVTREVVDTLSPWFRQPVIVNHPGEPLVLAPLERVETMILHDVGAFGFADQIRLLDWLQGVGGLTQVISTASRPILPLIGAGAFLDTLYYRLNSLYFEVKAR